eukprot:CAMPEP_0169205374 /NCGR_PEP_ID=MMETSP1016-20121227/12482_1 /TAXON_ID=342587 /ORGANISM="Karlodinium micrum, Strain CCMP2283" /LENGTH=187 /DNA_ID=CAMNT_0009282513 /DNA_START=52 /DNA_END=612 /DNA_ORIENTATION=-
MGSKVSCCGDLCESTVVGFEHVGSQSGAAQSAGPTTPQKPRFKTSEGGFQSLAGFTVESSSSTSPVAPVVQDSYRMPTLSSFVASECYSERTRSFVSEEDDDKNSRTSRVSNHPDSDTSEEELPDAPADFVRPRRNAVSNEATGMYNPRRAGHRPPCYKKSHNHVDAEKSTSCVSIFQRLGRFQTEF